MVIKQTAQQLAPVAVDALLKLAMSQASGVRPVQKANQRLKLLTARTKPSLPSRIAQLGGAVALTFSRTITTSLPAGKDFIARGVKFATTGVEIGGHVGHLRGLRRTSSTPTSTPCL